ncbi:Os07g0490450, partial [Oryza sativa Japonica Group]
MVSRCLLHESISMFELGIFELHPLKLYAPPAVRKNAYAHTTATLKGTCKQHISDTVAKQGYFSQILQCMKRLISMVSEYIE